MIHKLINKRLGGEVKRFHTVPMLKEHLVSSHSWGVALCVQAIHPTCRKELILAALEHDIHEQVTCDVNAVTKWNFPELTAVLKTIENAVNVKLGIPVDHLTPFEVQVLKTADMTDLILCCLMEYKMGNHMVYSTIDRGLDFLSEYCDTKETAAFFDQLLSYVGNELMPGPQLVLVAEPEPEPEQTTSKGETIQ